jgi:hypothetical protein
MQPRQSLSKTEMALFRKLQTALENIRIPVCDVCDGNGS